MSGRCKGATIKQLYPGVVFMHQGDFSFAMPPSEVCPTTFLPYTLFVNCALSCTSTVKYFNIECSSCIVPVGGDLTKISPLKTANSIHRGMQNPAVMLSITGRHQCMDDVDKPNSSFGFTFMVLGHTLTIGNG